LPLATLDAALQKAAAGEGVALLSRRDAGETEASHRDPE